MYNFSVIWCLQCNLIPKLNFLLSLVQSLVLTVRSLWSDSYFLAWFTHSSFVLWCHSELVVISFFEFLHGQFGLVSRYFIDSCPSWAESVLLFDDVISDVRATVIFRLGPFKCSRVSCNVFSNWFFRGTWFNWIKNNVK